MTEPTPVRVRACGKVNLALRVGPADESGYHELATVFQGISLYDEVSVVDA
ncbi:MAG TPA: 4-(cytidine 5'-diphospho)-2-C-methyl-D-erythritol kinase, partial [Propionibacteriaceae bacterium]|nr:4-(cytidine 5'-diphospho)-2-C-methyl-D-erythritol kinase [Propionibacteriaceae bacterium]